MTGELIMKLVHGLLAWLATNRLLAPVIPTIKAVIDNILPGIIAQVVPQNLTPAQIVDAVFNALLAELSGSPAMVFAIKVCQAAIDNALPYLISKILGMNGIDPGPVDTTIDGLAKEIMIVLCPSDGSPK